MPPPIEVVWFEVLNEIGIINQLASTAFSRALPHDLTIAQFTVLNHCVRLGDNWTPARLAAAFQITRGTLTATLKRLEAKGFIALVPDTEDGRSKRVHLTEEGRQAREDAIIETFPMLQTVSQALPAELAKSLIPNLRQLRIFLDENRS